MSNIFIQQEWKQVFQDQDAPFNEDLCVALINQAIKTRVDELAGNEVYLKAMSAYDQSNNPLIKIRFIYNSSHLRIGTKQCASSS